MTFDHNNYNVPDFMNIAFFNKVLKNGFDDFTISVTNVRVTGGTRPGQNYSSRILRANVTYSDAQSNTNTIALLVKYLNETALAEFVRKCGMFPKENEVYTCILPVLKDLLDGEYIAPRYFFYADEPTECIVFQDVSQLGYELGNAANGLDEKHCALVLRKLGKFHASSMVFALTNRDAYDKFNKVSDKNCDPPDFFINNIKHLVDLVATWPGYEDYAVKLEVFVQSLKGNPNILEAPTEKGINVLVHGDLWTNNVLFKYEDGEPTDVLFIDFQLSHYSSPGVDLMHFLYTSTELDILENQIETLVNRHYYESFKTTLHNSNYGCIPSFEDIRINMEKCTAIGFMWAMVQLFLICLGDDKTEISLAAFDDPEKGAELRNLGMKSERFVSCIKYILRQMEIAGFLK